MSSSSNLDFERKHAEDLERLRGFRLLDDDFMNTVFEDKACAEFLLQIILQRNDLRVQYAHGQHDIKNLQGRSVRLDILAVDGRITFTISRCSATIKVLALNVLDITAV